MYTLCLPKIDYNVSKKQLYEIFNKHNFGVINKIDLITISNSKRAFIHYNNWIHILDVYDARFLNNAFLIFVIFCLKGYYGNYEAIFRCLGH